MPAIRQVIDSVERPSGRFIFPTFLFFAILLLTLFAVPAHAKGFSFTMYGLTFDSKPPDNISNWLFHKFYRPKPTPTPTATPTPTNTPTPTAVPATPTPTLVPPTPTPVDVTNDALWQNLALCEAGGNWNIDTGNGYFGGLQFNQSAWESVGGTGNPAQASRDEQISKGKALQAVRGWMAWGACAKKLGLY